MSKRVEFDAELSAKPAEKKNPKTGKTRQWVTRGVNLRAGEMRRLDEIARAEGVSRNGLMRYIILEFMKSYSSGLVNLPTTDAEPEYTPTKKIVID